METNNLAQQIEEKLRGADFPYKIDELIIKDNSGGCGQMLQAFIISDEFQGVKLLERQKAVNFCVADEIAQIHALELKCWTQEQWANKKADFV